MGVSIMKKWLLLIALFMFGALLTGCGQNEKENDLFAQIKEKGELKIGTEGTYPPFTFHDETGELTGFDVEIAKEVAKRLGVKPVFVETQWDAMFAGLDAKRFDMIANQVGIRPDRQEKYDFSNPYITSAAVLVVHKENQQRTRQFLQRIQ